MKIIVAITLVLFQYSGYCQRDQTKIDWINMKKYAEANKTLQSIPYDKNQIVFMGNSITEFWKQIDSSFFSKKEYVNRGISGETSSQMLLRFRQDVIDLRPALVVILAGINDIAENTGPISLDDVMGNIKSMAELAGANKIHVVLCSVLPANTFPWRPDIKPADKVITLNAMIKSYADTHNIEYVDYYTAMVDNEKGLDKKYSKDGVHPVLSGYKIMEPLIEKAIAKALSKKAK